MRGWLALAVKAYQASGAAMGQIASEAHDEALYLILWSLGLSLDSPPSVLGRAVTPSESFALASVFRRRIDERTPAAYITHEAWLGGHRFYVDERVLIPRSYFLEIIPGELDSWLQAPAGVSSVVDVCTGSGCLAILLADHFPGAMVDAVDLSADALAVAEVNVREHGLTERVRLHRSDVFDQVPERRYDLIVSNPPYEPTGHVDRLAVEFKREPRLALDGGRDGLAIVRKLLVQSASRLNPGGSVMVEIGGLHDAVDREFAALEPHWLSTADGTDCVFVVNEARLRRWRPQRSRS